MIPEDPKELKNMIVKKALKEIFVLDTKTNAKFLRRGMDKIGKIETADKGYFIIMMEYLLELGLFKKVIYIEINEKLDVQTEPNLEKMKEYLLTQAP